MPAGRSNPYPPTNSITNAMVNAAAAIAYSKLNLSSSVTTADIDQATLGALTGENLIINGDFAIAQRGTSFTSATTPANSDDTYLLDRWTLLSDGNDIVDVSKITSGLPTGSRSAIRLDVETANKKFGIVQFVESANAQTVIGGTTALSFQAKVTGSSISNIRAAVLSWSSTADSLTSDVVNTTNWGGAGTDPTLATNWTYENTPSSLAVTTSWQTFTVPDIAIDTASTTNVAVFIWCDDVTTTVGDFLDITDVCLSPSGLATPYVRRLIGVEEMLCRRYGLVLGGGVLANQPFASGGAISTTRMIGNLYFPPMRTTPSASFSAAGDFLLMDNDGATSSAVTSLTITGQDKHIASVDATAASISITAGDYTRIIGQNTNARITLSSEL